MAEVWVLLWIQLTASRIKGNVTGSPFIFPWVFFWNFSLDMIFVLKWNFFEFNISKAKQSSESEIRVSYIPMACCHLLSENKDYALSVKQRFHNVCKGWILLRRHLQGESQREQKGRSLSRCKSAQHSWENPDLLQLNMGCNTVFIIWVGRAEI